MMLKSVLQDHSLSLSPLDTTIVIISVLKQKIHEYLPQGVQPMNVPALKTVLNDKVKFNLCLGNDNKYVAIELRILETERTLRERIGTLALLDTQRTFYKRYK